MVWAKYATIARGKVAIGQQILVKGSEDLIITRGKIAKEKILAKGSEDLILAVAKAAILKKVSEDWSSPSSI